MNRLPANSAKSRLPPPSQSATKTGVKRGIAGLNAKSRVEAAPIKVPKKSYNLNNLGPDAYPDGQVPGEFRAGGGGGAGADGLHQCYNCGRSFNAEAIAKHENICKKVFSQ